MAWQNNPLMKKMNFIINEKDLHGLLSWIIIRWKFEKQYHGWMPQEIALVFTIKFTML